MILNNEPFYSCHISKISFNKKTGHQLRWPVLSNIKAKSFESYSLPVGASAWTAGAGAVAQPATIVVIAKRTETETIFSMMIHPG